MKEILQFEEGELNVIMMWYCGNDDVTVEQFRKKLNGKLREKAEASREREERRDDRNRLARRPNCF